jgi:hypothetical protein
LDEREGVVVFWLQVMISMFYASIGILRRGINWRFKKYRFKKRASSSLIVCAEVIMQKTGRTPRVVAIDNVETNVVRLQRRRAEALENVSSLPAEIETLSHLMERASNAARQMRYFSLATRQFSFDELSLSATRAGFILVEEDLQLEEASFQWASGEPDLIFSVSFRDPDRVSIVAESQADIFGLILTAYSHISTTSVETDPAVDDNELGHYALLFRDMLLAIPGFDEMPAWTKYPEGGTPRAGGLLEMWRDGVSLASLFSWVWKSISPRVFPIRGSPRGRSSSSL